MECVWGGSRAWLKESRRAEGAPRHPLLTEAPRHPAFTKALEHWFAVGIPTLQCGSTWEVSQWPP